MTHQIHSGLGIEIDLKLAGLRVTAREGGGRQTCGLSGTRLLAPSISRVALYCTLY
jgi:hypothetical protein